MTTIISCVNLKGGVGKTTLAVNTAAYFGLHGKRTLLVDLDPQTNATFSCMTVEAWQKHAKEHGTVADLLGARQHANATAAHRKATEIIVPKVFKNVDLVPSHLDLFTIDLDMAGVIARETKLKKALQDVEKNYDVVVCDCPPNLTIPTQNALAASAYYLVPISADFLSALGIGILLTRINQLSIDLDQNLKLAGIIISRTGRAAHHRDEIVAGLRSRFKNDVLKDSLTERVAVAQAAAQQKSVFDMSDQAAISEFNQVCGDISKRVGM